MQACIQAPLMHDGVAGVAGGEQYSQSRLTAECLLGQLTAVHSAGHYHIGEKKIDVAMRVETFQRGGGAIRLQNPSSPACHMRKR